jgi:hypothetical protein
MFGWLKGKRGARRDPRIVEWHRAWSEAVAGASPAAAATLEAQLEAFELPDDEIEIEREMVEALRELARLRAAAEQNGLPVLETGHRVIGTDPCHFSAPVSMPDEATQPSGRLLFSSTRAVFVGGARPTVVAWHAVGEVLQRERDLVVVRKDRSNLYTFRCNSFTDALCGAFLARELSGRRQPRTQH